MDWKKPHITFVDIRNLVIGGLLLILGVVIGYRYSPEIAQATDRTIYTLVNTQQPREYEDVDFNQFWRVWQILEQDYLEVEKIDQKQMVDGAIKGMTASLGDPYTIYLPPVEQQRSVEDLQGSFYGIGVQLGYIEGTLAVIAPLKDNPAEQVGIQAGDLILHVRDDGKGLDEDTTGWSLTEAVNNIRGAKGTPVVLTLYRPDQGGEPFEIEVNRGEIIVESVELEFVEHAGKKVAHLSVSRFGERTADEWDSSVIRILQEPNLTGVVLDMRNNPGGFFERAIVLASDFIRKGIVVTQQGKYSRKEYQSDGTGRLADYPTMVLVNRGSASAAEIVAGAVRDQIGARLVGEQTFGKGTVQDARTLDNGGGLHVTIARWMLPGGSWIHDEGIPVDIEVAQNPDTEEDEVLLKAIEEL
jgi:carboxyl-terminal processing protease